MKRYTSASVLGICLTAFFLASCASSRTATQVNAPQGPSLPSTADTTPGEAVAQKEEAGKDLNIDEVVEVLLGESQSLAGTGRKLYEQGAWDEGRLYFQNALDLLKNGDRHVSEDPRVEKQYSALHQEMLTLEWYALIDPGELEFELGKPDLSTFSPLDEIAEVNLYAIEVDPRLEGLVTEDLKNTRFDVPIVLNDEVLKFLEYFQKRGRHAVESGLRNRGRYLSIFRAIFAEEGVPLDLIYMAQVESVFNPHALSRARAKGIWQFVEGTARIYGLHVDWWVDERSDVIKSTRAAARMLKGLYEEFGDWYLALAAYNGGPVRVSRRINRYGNLDYWTLAKRRLLPRETRNYVPSILAAIIIHRNPEKYGFYVEPDPELAFDTVKVDYQVDLAVVAEMIGVADSVLRDLNPELRRGVTPLQSGGFRLKVPVGTAILVEEKLAELPPEKRLRYAQHRVRQGETLSRIASRYGVSIQAIAATNHIRNVNRLKLNQELIIPLSGSVPARAGAYSDAASAESHTVRKGESLYTISRRYRVKLDDLFEWNDLQPGEVIHPGQRIRLGPSDSLSDRGNSN